MAHFVISYDLHNQRTYPPVWARLQSWGAVRLLESLWVVSSNDGAGDLRDSLLQVIDKDDSVVVVELKQGSNWSARAAQVQGTNWLQRNIRAY